MAGELLESDEVLDRRSGCLGLGLLDKTSFAEALVYLVQMERDEGVRREAKQTLRHLGMEDEMSGDAFRGLGLT